MASFFSHPALSVALKTAGFKVSWRLFILSMILTCLPDADVIAFKFGIPYESQWGHRGFTHSITFAVVFGYFCSLFHGFLGAGKWAVFIWSTVSLISHSFMDALTNGGLGVAIFWPIDHKRYFLPWQVVEVSPIGVKNFFTSRGLKVVMSEMIWIWLPLMALAMIIRRFKRPRLKS